MKAKWAPTPIPTHHAPIAIRVPEPPSAARTRDLWRTAVRLLWRRTLPVGDALRVEFERLGGLWIKVGQWLSMRGDLFPADFCAALASLQGRTVGFPSAQARAILQQQLGCPVNDVFDVFEDLPVAAASMGQVHRARLRREQVWVAVKVRTPFAVDTFVSDLAFLAVLVKLAPWVALLSFKTPQSVVRLRLHEGLAEMRRIVAEELDFRFEANYQARMRKSLQDHRHVAAPRVYARYSTEQVLVSEWVPGVLLRTFLDLAATDPAAAAAWCDENDVTPRRVARALILSLFRQIFEDNRFHGDLHPSNIMLLRGSRTVLLDFGTCSRTERRFLARFRGQVQAVAAGNYQRAAELTNQLTAALPAKTWWITKVRHASRIDALIAALVRTMETWAIRAEVKTLPYHEKSLNACTAALTSTVLKHGGSMQWAWMRIQRTMNTLDDSLPLLDPGINYVKVVRQYFEQAKGRVSPLAPLWALCDLWQALPDLIPATLSLPERVSLEMSRLRQELSPLQGL